ncbi:hypothetical protein [Streptosporangium sp. NPDC006007]|uniref:hypothetical protein n=1 Tax=Streptosporangium sp. NPDC006007 TaxID=3154575 RepID=UPI0033A15DF3
MTTDWFTHSCFVPRDTRETVGRAIDRYVDQARESLLSLPGPPRDLYLSGSLSRREPSVAGLSLASDVDFVLVSESRDAGLLLEAKLKDDLNARFPTIDTTVFTVQADQLASVRGLFGSDLHRSLGSPVVARLDTPQARKPFGGPQEVFEVFAHVMSNTLLGASSPAKLALEGLRCALSPLLPTVPSCGDVHRHGHLLAPLFDQDTVDGIVMAREVGTELGGMRAYDHLLACLSAFFLGPAHTSSEGLVLAEIKARIGEVDGLMNKYQLSLPLAFVLTESGHQEMREAALGLLSLIWRTRLTPDTAIRHLFAQRSDYYRLLSAHNFGRSRSADYVAIRHHAS